MVSDSAAFFGEQENLCVLYRQQCNEFCASIKTFLFCPKSVYSHGSCFWFRFVLRLEYPGEIDKHIGG